MMSSLPHPANAILTSRAVRRRSGVYQKDAYDGRQMRFGVREHGMSSVLNGMFAYGGLRPFGATFLNFITYAWGGVRLRYAEPRAEVRRLLQLYGGENVSL